MSTSSTESIAIAKRYATAMFELAVANKTHAALVAEIRALANAATQSPELSAALKNPLIHREQKAALLEKLMAKASTLTQQSLRTLALQGRAATLPYLADALDKMLADHEGNVVAEVTSARALSPEIERQLRDALSEATGRDVKLNVTEDPSVLGGVAIRVGSHLLDATLAGALSTMRTKLLVPTQ